MFLFTYILCVKCNVFNIGGPNVCRPVEAPNRVAPALAPHETIVSVCK